MVKRKRDQKQKEAAEPTEITSITDEDASKLVSLLSPDQRTEVLKAVIRKPKVLKEVRKIIDSDASRRKIFVGHLSFDTTPDGLKRAFEEHGEVEDYFVAKDKSTGKSRGFGFVTFKHVDGALNALRESSKKIDGRTVTCELAEPKGSKDDDKLEKRRDSFPTPNPSSLAGRLSPLRSSYARENGFGGLELVGLGRPLREYSNPRDFGGLRDLGTRDSGLRDLGTRDSGLRDFGARDSGLGSLGVRDLVAMSERAPPVYMDKGIPSRLADLPSSSLYGARLPSYADRARADHYADLVSRSRYLP